jgi:hypothetical protein
LALEDEQTDDALIEFVRATLREEANVVECVVSAPIRINRDGNATLVYREFRLRSGLVLPTGRVRKCRECKITNSIGASLESKVPGLWNQ